VAYIGDGKRPIRASATLKSGGSAVMERRRFKQETSLDKRLTEQARHLRDQAKKLPPSGERDDLVRRARQAETAAHLSEWLSSSGPQPPK
jgi:hypothetical protein